MRTQKNSTLIYALGGLGEIGKNTYCYEQKDEIIIVDAGIKFAGDELLGINGIIPDYSHLVKNSHKIKGLFITHGHEDHIGAIPFLLKQLKIKLKIYAPLLASKLILRKVKEAKTANYEMHVYNPETKFKSKNFEVGFCPINHSIPDSYAVYIKTENGRIIETGDYKFELSKTSQPSDYYKLAKLGHDGVTLLMADSTNSTINGFTPSERDIIDNFREIFRNAKGRIIVTTFASNLGRISQIAEIGKTFKRKICAFGRSMEKGISIAREINYLKLDQNDFIKNGELNDCPDNKVLILTTGSQGEELAALNRMALDKHPNVSIKSKDTIILSSSPIPGNYYSVEQITNKLIRKGATVIENSAINRIHSSGHACKGDQKIMFNLVKPKYLMPVHGNLRMQKYHAQTAIETGVKKENIFIVGNGDVIEMHRGKVKPLNIRLPVGPVYIDGNDTSGINNRILRDRKILSEDGVVSVIVTIDPKRKILLTDPYVLSRGLFVVRESARFVQLSSEAIKLTVNQALSEKENIDTLYLEEKIREVMGPIIYQSKKHNSLVMPIVIKSKKIIRKPKKVKMIINSDRKKNMVKKEQIF